MKRILRLPEVLHARGKSRSGHYDDIRHGLYTPPIKIGPRASAWPDDEVEILNAARIAGKSDQEIRELVCKLVAARAWADVWVHQMIQRPRGMAPTTRRARRAAEEASVT